LVRGCGHDALDEDDAAERDKNVADAVDVGKGNEGGNGKDIGEPREDR
jgi:hypothetical protein